MNKKIIVFTLIAISVIAIGSVVYFVRQDSKLSRFDAINIISARQNIDQKWLQNGDTDYLVAWANAINSGSEKFASAGIKYQTLDGAAIPA